MTGKASSPALVPSFVVAAIGSAYPEPFSSSARARRKQRLGDALGLKNIGVNLTTIPAGAASALHHWHSHEDEFIYIVSGELALVTNGGEQRLTPGMCAGFPAGKPDGRCLVNRTNRDAVYLEVGDRHPEDAVTYPDDEFAGRATPLGRRFTRKDGSPY
jgi:uncharacterized cupin superfamily protein